MAETFTWEIPSLGVQTEPHNVGDLKCPACCCHAPETCETCGGILHANMDDEMSDGEMAHTSRCDRPCACGYCPEPDAEASDGR